MASEYDRKFEEMKNYVPFLESMIKRLENTSGSSNPRQAQLDKIRSLRDLLLDKKKRMKMENLLKCEQVLVNLYAKVEQRDTLPGIDLKVSSNIVKVKDEPDLDVVRNKLKIVTKLQDELPDIARANDTQDISTSGAKEPALFQRRPNLMSPSTSSSSLDSKNLQARRNYTRVLVSPEPSPQRWSKQDDKIAEKPLFSRRSPRRQSPTYHRKDRKESKQRNSSKSNLNITLKVPEERLDSLNTSDIFSRIINCSDNDVDITTLRELRSQILGELKHTGAKDDISDLILNSSKKKKKKKSHKRKEEVEEGELSDSESEAIENIYGSLVILDKDQNASGQTKTSNKQEQKPRKIQIRLVINSENEATGSDNAPSTSDKKGLVSDLSDVSELEMFDCKNDLESKVTNFQTILNEKEAKFDGEIAPKVSELPDDESLLITTETNVSSEKEKVNQINNHSCDSNQTKQSNTLTDKNSEQKKTSENESFKPNFYKLLTENEPDKKENKTQKTAQDDKAKTSNTEKNSSQSSDDKESLNKKNVPTSNENNDVPKKGSDDIEIPLLNERSVASTKPTKKTVVSEIDILQALKNEILSDNLAIPIVDQATPALHQPKITKVASSQEIGSKKRISIEKYKQKSTPKPAVTPLFNSQSSLKDDNKKQSLKLTEKECERFKFALDNDLSSDDDIFDDLNKSDEDNSCDLAPKSPDIDEFSNMETNTPVIIPVDPVKNLIDSAKADIDMRTLAPIISPIATPNIATPIAKEKDAVSDKKQIKPEINRPSDPRLKRDSAPSNICNDLQKPVPSPLHGYTNITSSVSTGISPLLISPLTPSPNMTTTITPSVNSNFIPNMTPIRAPNMTPSMTPNARSFEIDDQPKRKHVYASLYDTFDYTEDIQRPHWEKSDKTLLRDPVWEPADERERNQHSSMQDRPSKINQEAQKYNRYGDSRSFYNYNKSDNRDNNSVKLDSQMPMYRRTDAPMTPSHPFGRSDCPPTPGPSFGRSDCPPTAGPAFGRSDCPPTPGPSFGRSDGPPTPGPSFGRSDCPSTPGPSFGRSECPPTPSHPYGRLDCPMTPSHPFGRSEGPMPNHSFARSECPMTPSHPFGRAECPSTPSHSFGRSECPATPTPSFGRSEMPMTPSHPFGRLDPRLQKNNEYESNLQNDDRNHRYFKDQYKNSMPYKPIHDTNSKPYNVDNYRNYREQSVGRNERNRPNYYKEQSSRHNEESISRHEPSGNRSRNYDHDQYNARGRKSDNDFYNNDKQNKLRDVETRSNFHRERSVGRTNPVEERQISSNSRARSVGRNHERDDENSLSVKPHAGRSFTIDTSINSTFQDSIKSNKEKSIFDQLFDRNNRASSVGRTFARETSVGRNLFRPVNSIHDNVDNSNRFRRARSVVRDTRESKSFSEIKADFESYRSNAHIANKRSDMPRQKSVDRNSPRISKGGNKVVSRKGNESKVPYSPRKNYRDPRLNRDSYPNSRNKQKDDRYKYDTRDKKKIGIIYSNDNIASGTILGSGYGVKNYKIPKIKRVEEVPPVILSVEKTAHNKQGKLDSKEEKGKADNKNKEKNTLSEKGSKRTDKVTFKYENADKKTRQPNEKNATEITTAQETDGNIDKKVRKPNKKPEDDSKIFNDDDNSDKNVKQTTKKIQNEEPKIPDDDDLIVKPRRSKRIIKESESESEEVIKQDTKRGNAQQKLSKEKSVTNRKEQDERKEQEENSVDTSFGIDDMEIFSDNVMPDPVIDSINSLIADLDDDINTSKNPTGSKFTNEISLENLLKNITSQSANEISKDISIDSALQEINKLIGYDASETGENYNKEMLALPSLEQIKESQQKSLDLSENVKSNSLEKHITESEKTLTNLAQNIKISATRKSIDINTEMNDNKKETKRSDKENEILQTQIVQLSEVIEKVKDNNKNEALNDSKTEEEKPITPKEADAIVSTTDSEKNTLDGDDSQSKIKSTAPDSSTNADDISKETVHLDSMPDSTDEMHTESSEVSSSNTAQLSSKEPEPSLALQGPASSDPLGNILSILQSKSKLKELLSMLGDQSSENDKIKKKLEKLSEIVSDEEDSRDNNEQDPTIGVNQESRDGTELEAIDNDENETSGSQNNSSLTKTEAQDSTSIKEHTHNKIMNKAEEQNANDFKGNETNESLDNASEDLTSMKKTKSQVKKVKLTRKRNGKFLKKISGDEKRVTRSDINTQKSAPTKKKVSRELLKLQEDIKEMFISDDVLNVTGIRMCRLAKLVDENGLKEVPTKDTEPIVVLEKINKNELTDDAPIEAKEKKIKFGPVSKKKPGSKSKFRPGTSDADERTEKSNTVPKYKPGPKSKTKPSNMPVDIDPYDFETDSINESHTSKMSEGSVRDSSDSESESLASFTSFGSTETLSELKPLSELKKKPKRKKSSWQSGVINKPKNKKKKTEKAVELISKTQTTDETQLVTIPDFNCFIDKKYCYLKNVFAYSCRLCEYSGEEIVAHYKKEHPHTEIPLSRLSPEVAKEAIEQCEEINFQAISKIPTDKYVCRFCYKEFGKKKAALESFFWHVVSMHTGEYKQICSECVNTTKCPFNLDIPPPPKDIKGQLIGYICAKCNFTQISLENLKTHVIVRHNDEQTEVYTINLAVMSRKIINILSKRVNVLDTDQPRALRSLRSNQSMAEMSDDRSDATDSYVSDTETKDDFASRGIQEKRKMSLESKSKLQSKITFENDDSSDTCNRVTPAYGSQTLVKIETEDLEEENRGTGNISTDSVTQKRLSIENQHVEAGISKNVYDHPLVSVNYKENGIGFEFICSINKCRYKCITMKAIKTHVTVKHKEQGWNGYCFDCKGFVNSEGAYSYKDTLTHFCEKHMDKSRDLDCVVSDVHFKISYSEIGIKQFVCTIEGRDMYQSPTLVSLKFQLSTHKGKWNGYCTDCKDFVKPQGEYSIADCLTHYTNKHDICDSPDFAPVTDRGIVSPSHKENEQVNNPAPTDIFAYPHFKVSYTDTGNKEFVCCINKTDEVHYKTPLLISLKRHVQTKHSENWDGYCFVCKVIVMPQGLHLFKDCLQHFLDKHMDDFPILEKEPEPEKLEEEAVPAPTPRAYINVRPLSQLKSIDPEGGLVLPKIESVVSLGVTSTPITSIPSSNELSTQVNDPEPLELAPEPETQVEEFYNYEASQVKVMSQKHPVVQEAMLRKEKLVRVYKCAGSYCSFATDSADMALSHALTHQKIGGENALCCSYCDFDCSGNAIDLVVHVFKHSNCPFSCGYCFYRAAAAQLVVAHSGTAHAGKQVKVYVANNAALPEKDTAKMLSREAVVQYYVCNHGDFDNRCKFKTYTARKFCDHLQTRHTGDHSCYICSDSVPTASELIQHMKVHELNLYQCTWCLHGADSEGELLSHAASTHPAHQPQAYLRIITNKDGSSEMRVLPLASFNRSSIGVEHVICSTLPEHPVKEAERSIDLQKLIGQTKLMFENITSTTEKPVEIPKTTEDMAIISPTPTHKTPPRTNSEPDLSEQPTPILKSEPAEITFARTTEEIVCLDSDEETANEDRSETSTNVIDISTDGDEEPSKTDSKLVDDKVFKCPKCSTCCKTDTGLKLHILKCYNPNWPMACPHCQKMTENRDDLIQHYISDHCQKYVCSCCNRELHSLKGAKTHMKAIHKINKVSVVYGSGSDQKHILYKVNSGPTTGATRAAPKRKLSMSNAAAPPAKQMKRYGPHDIDQLPINPILDDLVYCSLCEFNTKVRLNMVRHLQLHAEQQPAPQTAPVNPVPHLETNEMHFDKMVNLASSSLAKEKTKEVGPLVSQIPPEAAATYPKYVAERQRYTCGAKDCSYISLDETMLRCHWETLHSGTTEYRCVHCPPYQHLDKSKPLTAARIMLHLKMHDTALYACSSCTYYYFKKQIVEKHINDAHKGKGQVMVVREEATGPVVPATAANAPTMDLKPWQCGLCQFKSMLRPEVAEHCSKYHQSKMQFKCAYCPFRTSTLENVVKHQTNAHPGRSEEIFYYYYREGSVPDEDGSPKWMKQRQKMGITEDPVVKTEASDGSAAKSDPPATVTTPVSVPVAVDLNIVKKEVEEKLVDGELSLEELCRKFGQFCEPNGLRYKCSLCSVVTEDTREAMQSHLYEELQYRKWRCSICSYKAFHKIGLNEHIATEHRGRMQEPLPINLPVDANIEKWVAVLLQHQSTIIEKNKQNLFTQKVQTPGPSGLNAPRKTPEKQTDTPIRSNFNVKELELAFGPLGVSKKKEYCCPKCAFRTEKEDVMKDHLESELSKIRWCCSICDENFQTYHETLTHCRNKHEGQSARPKEAIRDPQLRAAWVTTSIQTQKKTIQNTENSLLKPDLSKKTATIGPMRSKNLESDSQAQRLKFNPQELEDAFGQFGVANNKQFCCPKCMFRSKSEEAMKEHLESELTKIRWSCSNCPEKFQTYHEAQFHCKSHPGAPARPTEAVRDNNMRAAWTTAVLQVQKLGMKAVANENIDFSPNKKLANEPEDSLLVVRYEEKVPIPDTSTSRTMPEPSPTKETSDSAESDDEKLVIDEEFAPRKVGNFIVCPHCPFQSKHRGAVKEHVYRHFGLYSTSCGYCEFTGYRPGVSQHLDNVHPHEPRKVKATPLPKGRPTIQDVKMRRVRRKNVTSDFRFCLLCQTTFTTEKVAAHSHGDCPPIFVKHGDIVINCKVCQTFRKDTELMEEHYAAVHPDKARNYFVYQILYNMSASDSTIPAFKRIRHLPSETIDINDDDCPPPKKVAKKSTTKLPMQAVAKKSTTKLPFLYISEDEEYSFYGTKPPALESFESVTTLMPFLNTVMPFSVKKLSEILQIDPRVVVKDYKK